MRTFGRYQLLAPIAAGGMAEVWRAAVAGPAGVRKEVALKLVRGAHDQGGDFARALVEEARLAARLSHANVVQLFELVEEDGRHAIAMELVRGRDLGRVLERAREQGLRLGLARAVHLGVEVARALDYAHRLVDEAGRPLGLVHRDVSPHNVLVSFEGEVKLADFGIARAMSQAGLTGPGLVKGKLAYMAPEQARGGAVDGRADLFSLGVLLWELCAGRRLFARDAEAATLAALLGEERPSPPSAWNEAVPPELDAVVLALLERDPARRTASAGALVTALAAVRHRLAGEPAAMELRPFMAQLWPDGDGVPAAAEPTALRPAAGAEGMAPPPREATGSAPTATALARDGGPRWRWRGRRGLALAVAVALGLGALAGLAWSRRPAGASTQAAIAGAPAEVAPAAGPAGAGPAVGPNPASSAGLELDPGIDEGAAARGEGVVAVRVHPWATVSVDGVRIGETPQDLRLQAGRHAVVASHPTLGAVTLQVEVTPGRRVAWHPDLSK